MRYLSFVAPLLFAFSCCPKPIESSRISDATRVERTVSHVETVRDTIVYHSIAEQHAKVITRDSSYLSTSYAESTARIQIDGTLHHTLDNLPQEIPIVVTVKDSYATEYRDSIRVEYRDRTVTLRERYVPAIYKFALLASILSLLYVVSGIIRRLRKPYSF